MKGAKQIETGKGVEKREGKGYDNLNEEPWEISK